MWYHVVARLEAEREANRKTLAGRFARLAPRRTPEMHSQVRHAAVIIYPTNIAMGLRLDAASTSMLASPNNGPSTDL